MVTLKTEYSRNLCVLQIGTNPITMDGCRKILEVVDKENSSVIHVNLEVHSIFIIIKPNDI